MWAYRRGNGIIASSTNIYGSDRLNWHIVENFSSIVQIDIKRSEIKALDKPWQRCDPSENEPSVSKCVEERLVEKYLNCSLKRLMSNPMLSICKYSKVSSTANMLSRMNRMDEREIFEMTGCKPGCSKSKIKLIPIYQDNMIDNDKREALIQFYYSSGEYDLYEEYYIYNFGTFIADVGGYLGLLLGYSILSMYHSTIPVLMSSVTWLVKRLVRLLKRNQDHY